MHMQEHLIRAEAIAQNMALKFNATAVQPVVIYREHIL